MERVMSGGTRLLADRIGFTTLVGVIAAPEDYPLRHGNCFSLCAHGHQHHVLEMRYEDFKELLRRGVLSWPVEVTEVEETGCVRVTDPRVPADWKVDKWCTICTPNKVLIMNGQEPNPPGVHTVEIQAAPKKLRTEWVIEEPPDVSEFGQEKSHGLMAPGFVYAPYIPKIDRYVVRGESVPGDRDHAGGQDWPGLSPKRGRAVGVSMDWAWGVMKWALEFGAALFSWAVMFSLGRRYEREKWNEEWKRSCRKGRDTKPPER